VREHFEKGVLNRFVGIVRVAQVVIGDPDGAPLLVRDEIAEFLARRLPLAGEDQRLDLGGQLRVLGEWRRRDGLPPGLAQRGGLSRKCSQGLYGGRRLTFTAATI
jgi:hypothetical protein